MSDEVRPRRVTMNDVAAAVGISRTTASHALSGQGRVSAETVTRVRQVAEEMGYSPSPRALALRTGRTRTIAVVSSLPVADIAGDLNLDYFMAAAASAAQEAILSDYTVTLIPPTHDTAWTELIDVDGAIVLDPFLDDPVVSLLVKRGIAVVTVGFRTDSAKDAAGWVDIDFVAGANLVLDHLWERGSRRPMLMSTQEPRGYSLATTSAYEKWCMTAGVEPKVVRVPEEGAEAASREATKRALDEAGDVDAIFAPFDRFCGGVMSGVLESGRRVPEDVRVVTLEGSIARHISPPVTALDDQWGGNARKATRALLDRLEDPTLPPLRDAVTPELIVRATT